ncbi:protein of unknown function [Lishizhenia tianjinensis]|uniref:DUF4270 domain-containing protein n=1 Tax=Lishizhenia tianjinensis TaxID=477690 RepID=A0A1I7B337_9FLAO|nr:DUF4270 family protein [Lishizhenia tianjinensis]SFT81609.1 protein of unknown function [Lishizhenia tianjinensis]
MKKINISTYKSWREVNLLLATFLCLGLLAVSCKKKDNLLGTSVLPDGTTLSTSGIDTFSLYTYSVSEDSVSSLHPNYNLLGSYIDPVFGSVDASFYTQVDISNLNPTFGNDIKIDSMVFSMVYGGYYGNLDEQTVEIYQVTEDMDLANDETYYGFSTLNYDPTNLVTPNTGTFTPTPETPSVVDGDTVTPQLRVHMDTNFARTLIDEAKNGTSFSSSESFKDYLKGFYIKTNNPTQSVDEGGILYFSNTNAASLITIYYREMVNGSYETFSYTFLISSDEIDFNHFESDQTGTNVENVISNPSAGLNQFYAQAFTTRAKIDIPSLSDIPYGAIVQQATLTLPVSYYTTDLKNPSLFLSSISDLGLANEELSAIASTVTYDDATKAYTIDLRTYIQKIITGEYENNGILISPSFFNTTAERIIFNGPNTTNKKKPTLNILLTDN